MPKHECKIYVLFDGKGRISYVGRTGRSIEKRINEHRTVLGFRPRFAIIDRCSENCREVEKGWIAHYRNKGTALRNVVPSSAHHFWPEHLRKRFARHEPRRAETKRKLAESQKLRWASYTKEQRQSIVESIRAGQRRVPRKVREAIGRKGALIGWAKWTPEEREIINSKISQTILRDPTKQRDAGHKGGTTTIRKPGQLEKMRSGKEDFWRQLRADPKRYEEYVRNQAAKRKGTIAARGGMTWLVRDPKTGKYLRGNRIIPAPENAVAP